MEFIKTISVYGVDVIQPEELSIYWSLVQEAVHEYRDPLESSWWDTASFKEYYQ